MKSPLKRLAPVALAAAGLLLSSCAALTPAAAPVSPWEARAATGRGLLARYADAVVELRVVTTLKLTLGNRTLPPQEVRREVNATVLTADGLTVTSLSAIDPRGTVEARANGALQRLQVNDVEFKETKIKLADGTEIAARVVLKDPDLDLAFVAPLPSAGPAAAPRAFAHVDLSVPASAEILGEYYTVARAAEALQLQRSPVVREMTIEGIAEKPRRIFLIAGASLGCPAFDAQGRVLGICLTHVANGRPVGDILMPSADIAQGAKAAAAAAAKPAANTGDADDAAQPPAAPAPAAGNGGPQAPP